MLQHPDKNIQRKLILYYFALFLVAFISLLPLTWLHHPLKYDIIDQTYPWRYFIGECLQKGILPLWNPYQILGAPIYVDSQSWYPVVWFFGYLFGYDIYSMSIEFFLHIFLAGMGMFYLGRKLQFRMETSFLMAAAYMLSGFFIGNAQHMSYIVSGAWIPFILGAFIALRERPAAAGALRLSLVSFLMLTGGYPSFTLILVYLLLAMFIYYLVGDLRTKEYARLRRYMGFLVMAATITLLMASVVLVGVYQLQQSMTRGGGVTLGQALFGAFTPKSLVSFILPYAAIRNMEFFGTDLSMSNGYFGLLPLLFFFLALTMKRPGIINLFLAWGLFWLLASMGDALPVREFLYHYVPLMDQFRFPAAFRIFTILGFLVVAGFGFNRWMDERLVLDKRIRWIIVFLGIILAGFAIAQLFRGKLDMINFIKYERPIFSERSTVAQHIFFQSLIQLIMLGVVFIMFLKMKMSKWLPVMLLVILSADMAMATRLNSPYTVYSHIFSSKDIYEHSRQFPDGFPVPEMEYVIENRDSKLGYKTFWRNMNMFHKKISYDGYSPFQLNAFVDLQDNHPILFETILHHPPVYLSGKISPVDSIPAHEAIDEFDRDRTYLEAGDWEKYKDRIQWLSPGDTAFFTSFSPVKMKVWCINQGEAVLNLLQFNAHGWRVSVDHIEADLMTANLGLISVALPPGEHEVVFSFSPTDVRVAFYISLFAVLSGIMWLGVLYFRREKHQG